MRLTNNLGLPQPIVDAIRADTYTRGNADISITGLLDPPRKVALTERHGDEIVEDAADRIWSLMGQAVHTVLERANRSGIVEQRLSIEVEGWTISGSFDHLCLENDEWCLSDWKFVSTWEGIFGLKPEREKQLNCYAALCREHGYKVDSLRVGLIFRDWAESKAERDRDYPQKPVAMVPVPMWPHAKTMAFIAERVRMHQAARAGDLPLCSAEERWARGEKWAVMKRGRKAALRLFDTKREAVMWASAQGLVSVTGDNTAKPIGGTRIERRPGVSMRCKRYCQAGGDSNLCDQWIAERDEHA